MARKAATAARISALPNLDPVALLIARRKKVSVKEAAELNNLSEQTFRRHYQHLIIKVAPRRDAVTLEDALTLPPPEEI